jgi:NADH dehydrogenase
MYMSEPVKKRILILGGGFGGIYAAMRLEKVMGRDSDIHITLVNKENFFLFTPMLHEVAASDLELTNIVSPIRELLHHTEFFCGDVDKIDLPNKLVTVSHGYASHTHDLKYDYLIVALGSTTNYFKLPGVETIASINDLVHDSLKLYRHIDPKLIRVVVVHPGELILPELGPELGA